MRVLRRMPEHLESDPGRRREFCPISITTNWETNGMTIPELQNAIIESTNKAQAIQILLDFCGRFGINSNAPPEWWAKREKLVEANKKRVAVDRPSEWRAANHSP